MSRLLLLVYAGAHFGKSLMWQASGLAFAFFLTEVIGFAPAAMGWLLGGSLALNAAMDLALGWALRARVQSVRAAGQAQAAGAIVATVMFTAFAGCALIAPEWRGGATIAALLAFRVAYSAMDVPQNAILALASTRDSDRIRIAAARYAAAGLSLIVLSLALAPWLTMTTASDRAPAFLWISVAIAATALAGSAALFAASRRRPVEPGDTPEIPLVTREAKIPYVLALASIIAFSGLAPIFSKLQAYLSAYGLSPAIGHWFLPAVAAGQVAGQIGWSIIGRRIGLLNLYRSAAIVLVLACAAFFFGGLRGGLTTLAVAALYGAASSGLLMAIWAWLAASAGARGATTFRFGLFTFCSKLAQAAGLAVIGYILAHVPYKTPGGLEPLILVMASAPAIAAGLCFLISLGASRGSQANVSKPAEIAQHVAR